MKQTLKAHHDVGVWVLMIIVVMDAPLTHLPSIKTTS